MYINNIPSPCYVSNSDISKGFVDLICEYNKQKVHVQVVFNLWELAIHLILLAILTILGIACKKHFINCCNQQQKIGHVWVALKVLIVFNMVLWLCITILFALTLFWSDSTIIIVYTYFNVIVVVVNVMTATFILHQVNDAIAEKHEKGEAEINIKSTRTKNICKKIVHILSAIAISALLMFVMVQQFNRFEAYQTNVNMTLRDVHLILHLLCIFAFGLAIYQCISFLRNIVANKSIETTETHLKAYQLIEVEEAQSTDKKTSSNNKTKRVGVISLTILLIWLFCFSGTLMSFPSSSLNPQWFLMIKTIQAFISLLIPEFYLLLTNVNED